MPGSMYVPGERPLRPPSPENCTIIEETSTTVRVSCAESDYVDPKSATYVLQVYDAETRHLLASDTSVSPDLLKVTDLPAERRYSGLKLVIRVMTSHATSDATVLYSQHLLEQGSSPEHQIFPGRGNNLIVTSDNPSNYCMCMLWPVKIFFDLLII